MESRREWHREFYGAWMKFILFMFVVQTGWQIVPVVGNPYDSMMDCRRIGEALKRNNIFDWPGGVKATGYACQELTGKKDAEKDDTAG